MAYRKQYADPDIRMISTDDTPPPPREKWPFRLLDVGQGFETTELGYHMALRSAATRYGKKLRRKFSVRKMLNVENELVIAVFRER